MTTFLSFQSIVTYRVPVNADGSIGNPEIVNKFTRPIVGTKTFNKKVTKAEQKALVTDEVEVDFL